MNRQYDIVIRGGTVIDGSGRPGFAGDVGISGDRITAVGAVEGGGSQEIDARGLIVTPGFIDVHTHYDGQVCWDPLLTPSSFHGVTTAIMGNCGVGFAPVKAPDRAWAIGLMEGVEAIPSSALNAGITWHWETFPEYLDYLESQPLAISVGTQVPHGPLRTFVMGERGANDEPAGSEDIAEMARLVHEALEAGALGFSTSRVLSHRGRDGRVVPGTRASQEELFAIGRRLGQSGHGVFEVAPVGAGGRHPDNDPDEPRREVEWMRHLASEIQRPVVFALTAADGWPDKEYWRRMADTAAHAWEEGVPLHVSAGPRAPGTMYSLSTFHAFSDLRSYQSFADLPLGERAARMKDRSARDAILAEVRAAVSSGGRSIARPDLREVFVVGEKVCGAPSVEESVEEIAKRSHQDPWEAYYDCLLADGGEAILARHRRTEPYDYMLSHPGTVFGLGDGGAHVEMICDASAPTILLYDAMHEGSSVASRARHTVEWAVWKQSGSHADVYGLNDRGRLEAGRKADVNVIDPARLSLRRPRVVHDLPGGEAPRLVQKADGYAVTIVNGEVAFREGVGTGSRSGVLIRGGA